MRVLSLLLAFGIVFAEEEFYPENPSNLYDNDGVASGLENQVGKAIITNKEIEAKKAEEEKLAALDEAKRLKEEARLARIAERRSGDTAPPEECIGYNGTSSVKIKSGDTLGKIAVNVYGNSAYSTLISVFNKKPANKLFIGEEIMTPSPYEIFTELDGKAVWEKFPYAIRDLIKVQEKLKKMKPVIIEEKRAGKYSDDTKGQLDQMIWEMGQVKADFLTKIDGIDGYPISTLSQLQSAANNLKLIRKGDLGKGNRNFTRFDLYAVNCYSYAIAWGRDGFKSSDE